MKNRNDHPSTFNLRSLILAAVPAYVFPALMSFTSGFFLQKNELMSASYTSIGLSSLLSTVVSFMILWQFEFRQILAQNKLLRSVLIVMLMISLGMACSTLLNLQSERFNITFSAFLGAAILTIRQQIKKS
ncbi:hypothetical protein [Pedobacter polysacchareus]|uniref:hypothetical protein n=1 Tax=Pedobacter polysacchareus TaxID=2861973 RepID=UPI001C98F6F4|nr:hypothetical protein [Pedobacter polysacchareus]